MKKQIIFVIISDKTDLPIKAVDSSSEAIKFCTNEKNHASWMEVPFYKFLEGNKTETQND
jgi:hypothetical protein